MRAGLFVVNASPLIFLSKIEALQLLSRLASEVVVPAAVRREVLAGGKVELPEWLRVQPDLPLPAEIAGWDLGAGESQVLAQATSIDGSEAVLDDLQARRCARALGIAVTGTLGVILRARKSGVIPAARPLLEDLLRRGLYLSRDLVEAALTEVGE